jgi:hypothetical protein
MADGLTVTNAAIFPQTPPIVKPTTEFLFLILHFEL